MQLLRAPLKSLVMGFPLAVALAALAQPAQAALTFNFYESGSDLVVEGTGSLLSLPSSSLSAPCGGALELYLGFCTGQFNSIDLYEISGPTTLGSGIVDPSALSSSDSGIALGIIYSISVFGIDSTYVSGAPIVSSSTFSGITLASLGMPSSGTLGTWTLVDPDDPFYIGDTISVQVNASATPASVPGPLPVLGLGVAFSFSRRLRRLHNRSRLRPRTSQPS